MDPDEVDRIRFVTRRYQDLQGLRQLVILPACLLAFWSQPYVKLLRYDGPVAAGVGLLASLVPLLIVVWTRPLLDRYYRRRFGCVAADRQQRWLDVGPAAALLVTGLWIDMSRLGTSAPSAVLIAGTLLGLHVTIRDWPWRAHHLIPAIGCAIGASATAMVPAMRVDNLQEMLRSPFTILMVSNIVAAYLDHRLLVRTLPPNSGDDAEIEAAAPVK